MDASREHVAEQLGTGWIPPTESLLEALPDGILLADIDGRILFVNAHRPRNAQRHRSLTLSIGMALQGAASYLSGNEEAEKRIAEIVEQLDCVVRDVRQYVFGLEMSAGAESGSATTIERASQTE